MRRTSSVPEIQKCRGYTVNEFHFLNFANGMAFHFTVDNSLPIRAPAGRHKRPCFPSNIKISSPGGKRHFFTRKFFSKAAMLTLTVDDTKVGIKPYPIKNNNGNSR